MIAFHLRRLPIFVAGLALLAAQPAFSQSYSDALWRKGWEGSIGLLYQDENQFGFNGGSSLRADNGFGFVGAMGYNFSPKLDLIFGFDSASIDYTLTRQSATTPGETQRIATQFHSFTPYVKLHFNFLDRPITPFVSAGIGWSFIDTNIPTGNVFVGCWYDPWWGYFCAPFQETETTDAFAYQAGVGARWTFNQTYGMRFEYQKQWVNLSRASGSPNFDQLKLTLVVRY